jgi:putative ABC transport system permease protein
MAIILYFKQFLHDLQAQKLRTLLTLIGLTWGTVTVICLLAFGYGLQKQQEESFKGLGDDIVIMWASRTSKPFAGYPKGRWFGFQPADVDMLKKEISEMQYVSGEYMRNNVSVRSGRNSKLIDVSVCAPWFLSRGDGS